MYLVISKKTVASVIGVLFAAAVSMSAQAGEKKRITATSKSYWTTIENMATPAGPEDLLVYRAQRLLDVTSSDSNWNGARWLEWEFGHESNNAGVHEGYDTEFHKDGDQSYQRFTGTHKLVKPYPDFEYHAIGTIEFVGGTGKFKNIKGKGKYKAVTTPAGSTTYWEADVEY